MKKFGKFKLFGLVIIFTIALVFVGIDSLGEEPEPEWTWNVTIPGYQALDGVFYNLYGLPAPYSNTYKDEDDRVYVIVEKKKGGKEYLLRLFIYHSVYDKQCTYLDYPHQIGFQNLDLVNVPHSSEGYYVVPEEFPCYFPNYKDYTGECYPAEPQSEYWWLGDGRGGDPRTGRVPGCMKHFLEVYPHPYCDIDCDIYVNTQDPTCEKICPDCVYRNIDIRITVDHNIEKMGVGEIAHPTAVVWVEVDNYNELQTGLEDWHNISGLLKRDKSTDCITITRSATDTWEIIVDTVSIDPSASDQYFIFNEIYTGGYGKGKSWEYKIPYWTRTPFKFITTWTKSPKPVVSITSPDDGSTFDSGASIQFEGTASDTKDGDLTYSLEWTSSIDGSIGPTGGSFSTTLSDGVHTITASVTNSDDNTSSNSITITVGTPSEPGTVSVASIDYSTKGGKNGDKHLDIICTLEPTIAGATVWIDLYLGEEGVVDSFTGTTDSNGQVTFTHRNAKSGYYTSTVTAVTAAGWTWDSKTPANEFNKK